MDFARRESLYILLLVFIIFFNVLVAVSNTPRDKEEARKASHAVLEKGGDTRTTEGFLLGRDELEKKLKEKPAISAALGLTSLAFLVVVVLGLLLDAYLLSAAMGREKLDIATYAPGIVRWSLLDVAKVVILFLFFAYILVTIESFLVGLVPVFKDENFRMMFNSTLLDVIAAVFVIYFAVYKYKEKLVALGLTMKNMARNIFYGIAGYIASIPIFLLIVAVVYFVVKLTSYVPEKQPVVELFLKEENPTFLIFSSIFASLFGPFIEELFFRGFMYNAARKRLGVFWGMLVTSGIFAALHANIVGFVPIMALGFLLTYVYQRTGSLVPSIAIHVVHNLATVTFVFLVKGIQA